VSVGRVLAAACVAVSACLLAACAHDAPAPTGSPAAVPPEVAASPVAPTSVPAVRSPRPDHVVIVMLENKDEGDALRQGPYLASLAASGASLTDMHAETHPSQPNYLALFSGGTQGVDDDSCPHTFAAGNLASELTAAGYTFAGYSEDLPATGFAGCVAGGYARKHSPWTNFRAVPASANQPLSAMPTDYAALPTVSFLIPNLCHDMHDCSVATGDAWARDHLDGYVRWAREHNSVLLVTFDEDDNHSDNRILTFFTGGPIKPGRYAQPVDHYGVLATLEDWYGLPRLGQAATAAPITGILGH